MKSLPYWRFYRAIRMAAALELAAARAAGAMRGEVTQRAVDDYLRLHLPDISRDVRQIFRSDLRAREERTWRGVVRGVVTQEGA